AALEHDELLGQAALVDQADGAVAPLDRRRDRIRGGHAFTASTAARTPSSTPPGCAYAREPRSTSRPDRAPARRTCSAAFSGPTPPPSTAVARRAPPSGRWHAATCARTCPSSSSTRPLKEPTCT